MRVNGRRKNEVPRDASYIIVYADTHDNLLFWTAIAFTQQRTGYLLDFGTYPEQASQAFTLANAQRTLRRKYPESGRDGAIYQGIQDFVATMFDRTWKTQQGMRGADKEGCGSAAVCTAGSQARDVSAGRLADLVLQTERNSAQFGIRCECSQHLARHVNIKRGIIIEQSNNRC